jgi:membrane-associated phospholipid phosphatase
MSQKIKKTIKTNYKWIIFFICLILFLALAEDIFTKELIKSDTIGYELISTYLIKDNITPFAKTITFFGSPICLILTTIILFILIKNKKIGLLITINLITITILNQLLKFILQRPRPEELRIINENGYSFPSGHSMVSMAFYGLLIYLIYKNIKNKYTKTILILTLSLLIIMIGISRIYLGVHYTSDVLAGFLLSISYLIVYINITKKMITNNKKTIKKTKLV